MVCSFFQDIRYFHISLFIYSKRIVCVFPRDRHRTLNAKLFLYRQRNVQTAIDTGGVEWVVTDGNISVRPATCLCCYRDTAFSKGASTSKNRTFFLLLQIVCRLCSLPDADVEVPNHILQSVCTSGFCRVLFNSSHLILPLSLSLSLSLSLLFTVHVLSYIRSPLSLQHATR
jgi:hypothetical protein